MKIFLSYASEDRSHAEPIYYSLLGEKHDVFFDRESLAPGREFDTEIRNKINESDLFIFLLSPNSVDASSYTLTELKLAKKKWRHPKEGVLPVMITATNFEDIPGYLKAVTIFETQGNIAAEVSAHVDQLQNNRKAQPDENRRGELENKSRDKKRKTRLIGVAILLLLSIGLGITFNMFPKLTDPDPDTPGIVIDKQVLAKCQNTNPSQDPTLKRTELSIFKAAGKGYIDRVKECLASGINVNSKDGNGWTALHAASANGYLEIVRLLLSKEKIDINALDNHKRTPLFHAVNSNQYKIVNFLLENGADKNKADSRGNRPIARAKSQQMKELLGRF